MLSDKITIIAAHEHEVIHDILDHIARQPVER